MLNNLLYKYLKKIIKRSVEDVFQNYFIRIIISPDKNFLLGYFHYLKDHLYIRHNLHKIEKKFYLKLKTVVQVLCEILFINKIYKVIGKKIFFLSCNRSKRIEMICSGIYQLI